MMNVIREGGNGTSVQEYLERSLLGRKLNNPLGYVVMVLVALIFGYLVAKQTFIGLGLLGAIVAVFVVLCCLISPEVGLYINIFYSFFAFGITRYLFMDSFPVGVGTDVLIVATFASLLIHHPNVKQDFGRFVRTPVVIAILVVVVYLGLEVLNPYADSIAGWSQTFRRFFESLLLLFIAYCMFSDPRSIHRFIKALFGMALVTALYGCLQHWHGLFDFEVAWVMATENRFGLIFINGDYRKFSTMSDPTAFGIAMAACSIFFMVIAWHQKKTSNRLVLIGGIVIMLLAMAYSGTRTANAMLVIGLAMYVLLSFNRVGTRAFAFAGGLAFLFLMYVPIYSNNTINRFRSSFSGSEDESFKVREVNRKYIQPFIYSHPIGWGLGTTGAQGLQYNPNHFLAGFPPDSGYLKKALETGWIGLALTCIFYFVIVRFGIRGYFRTKSDKRKILFVACTATLFAFYIAEFAQEAIGQISDMVIYYPLIALMIRMHVSDEKQREKEEAVLSEEEEVYA